MRVRDRTMVAFAAIGATVFAPVAMVALIIGDRDDTGDDATTPTSVSPSSPPSGSPPPTGGRCFPFQC
ncbi:hypothetical protein [Nocardia paucivorans]|uniref:hypothetical protein n=1 Tax=Nocardia paucivorans TaxID=114259 RepID=UPI0002F3C978|nr:hypothetical protein [Nocardia paucivorans]